MTKKIEYITYHNPAANNTLSDKTQRIIRKLRRSDSKFGLREESQRARSRIHSKERKYQPRYHTAHQPEE